MAPHPRLLRRLHALVLLPLLLVLTGCMTFDGDVTIHDDSVDLRLELAIREAYRAQIEDTCRPSGTPRPGVTVSEFLRDGYYGCVIEGRGVPLERFADATSMTITRTDAEYAFSWSLADDRSTAPLPGGMVLPTVQSAEADQFDDFSFSVTFPGEVLSHNGSSTVVDRTVTWSDAADAYQPAGMIATGRRSVLPGWVLPAAAAAGALVVCGLVGTALWSRRRSPGRGMPAGEPERGSTTARPDDAAAPSGAARAPWEDGADRDAVRVGDAVAPDGESTVEHAGLPSFQRGTPLPGTDGSDAASPGGSYAVETTASSPGAPTAPEASDEDAINPWSREAGAGNGLP